MKKHSLLVILALVLAVGMVPLSAHAGELTNGGTGGVTYATEIFGTGSDAQAIPSTATATAIYTFGNDALANNIFDITFTLDKGTWGAALLTGSLAYSNGGGTATAVLFSGGGATDTNAVYRVSVGTTKITAGESLILTYNLDGLSALNTADATVKISATLGYIPSGVAVDTNASKEIAKSGNGVTNAIVADPTAVTIDVATHSTLFTGAGALDFAPGAKNEVKLGTVGETIVGVKQADGATAWNVRVDAGAGRILAAVTLDLTGNFSASKNVKLDGSTVTGGLWIDFDGNSAYTAGEAAIIAADGLSARWTLTDAQLLLLQAAAKNVYMVVDGTNAVAAQTPKMTMTVNYTTTTYDDTKDTKVVDLKALAKNGTTLVSPWISSSTGYTSRFLLTNMNTTSAAEFNVTVYTASGDGAATLKAPYDGSTAVSVPAGKQLMINVKDMVTLPGQTRASVAFEFLAPANEVQAIYQFFNTTTGLMDNVVLNPPH